MKSRYLIRPRADQDLEEQAEYLAAQGGSELGDRFLLAAHDAFELLGEHPHIGWKFRVQIPAIGVVRAFSVPRFAKVLVLYRAIDNGVEILRVLHGSRNLHVLLLREPLE